jgi:hypothetical protein
LPRSTRYGPYAAAGSWNALQTQRPRRRSKRAGQSPLCSRFERTTGIRAGTAPRTVFNARQRIVTDVSASVARDADRQLERNAPA